MPKIYLSPAAHAHDNSTKCPMPCGENVHANQYMDLLEPRLKELGFEVKRGDKSLTGSTAMRTRVTEANKWKADLYYVSHTNAGGGRRSMTIHYPNENSKRLANIMHKYRKAANNGNHRVVARSDLYEINATSMPCLYDELFFHDNAEDCAWFHNGGMELMVEETCRAFCEIFNMEYKPHEDNPQPGPVDPTPVDDNKVNVYYRVRVGKNWLPEVKNLEDYAGATRGILSKPITGVAIRVDKGSIRYRVHTTKGRWLGYITKCDINDYQSGYAGDGNNIDAIEIYYTTPTSIRPYKCAYYRVSPCKKDYYSWQIDTNKGKGMDGYAGSFGKAIDRLQIEIK